MLIASYHLIAAHQDITIHTWRSLRDRNRGVTLEAPYFAAYRYCDIFTYAN